LRVDAVLGKTRGLIIVLLSLTLIVGTTAVALALQDYIFTYSDAAHTLPATTFGDGDTVYVTVTDNNTTGGTKTMSVTNDVLLNSISVSVTEAVANSTVYEGSFIIHSGVDEAGKLHMEHGQTATIYANLDGNTDPIDDGATKQITADYGITPLTDMIWIYSDSSRTVEETVFGDGDTIYLKITDTQTKGGTKAITVQNSTIGNTISVNVTDSDQDSFYLGSFIIHSGANDDANDKLTMFNGQAATITADLANDGLAGTGQITADYAPTAAIACNPSPVTDNTKVTVTLEASEDLIEVPTVLTISFSDDSTLDIVLMGTVPGSTFIGFFTLTDEIPDGQATFSLTEGALVDGSGNTGNEITSGETLLIDRIGPPAPSSLSAMATQDDKIKLTWTAASEEDVNQYNIYRGTDSGHFPEHIGTVTASGQSSYEWLDSDVVLGTTYYYVVRAQDAAGNESENSPQASATISARLLSFGFQRPPVVQSGRPIKVAIRVRQPATVRVRILNLNGEIVYDWNEYISSEEEWTWDGVNMHGKRVNNGVYIWKIEADADDGTSDSEIQILGVAR